MKVSVIIKAYNEEANVTRAIESALAAVAGCESGEVILADSLSSDHTVERALRYPVRIVQLTEGRDRCCGVGAELGYQIAQGDFLYLLDADMELNADFLPAAVALLESEPGIAGVGGLFQEMNICNTEFRDRVARHRLRRAAGDVDRLNMGGLYRRSVIGGLGYLTNRNLHAFEEFELGVRVRRAGFRLFRLDQVAAKHYGHTDGSFELLRKRWKNRHLWASGELLRESFGRAHFPDVVAGLPVYRVALAVIGYWVCAAGTALGTLLGGLPALVPILVTMGMPSAAIARKRSVRDGTYTFLYLNMMTAGLIAGTLSARRGDPGGSLPYSVVR